jgi:hypothetical protein
MAPWAVGCSDESTSPNTPPSMYAGESSPTDPVDKTEGNDGFGHKGDGSADLDGGSGGKADPSCASDTVEATRKPVKLVMALDQSGSMGLVPYGDITLKWNPVTQAFSSFLGDPSSKGIEASLRLFPKVGGETQADKLVNCSAASYASPDVAMTALPNANAFTSKLPAVPPGLQTPTRAILKALVADALVVKQQNPNDAVAILLMTDGDPIGCGGVYNKAADEVIATVAAEAKVAAAAGIPVYVIGVGTFPNLDLIAAEGGTSSAFVVPANNAAATKQQFLDAVEKIRTQQLSCELDVVAPKSGSLDLTKATVIFTPGTGAASSKPLDVSCTQGGFKYDDAIQPKKVLLCPTLCAALKADPKAKVSLSIPCAATSPK